MTKMIEPRYINNRAKDKAYGCGCICSGQWKDHEYGRDTGIAGQDCTCTCHSLVNAYANADLAAEHQIWNE